MTYLIHFNPNHDKLGRFTFSRNSNKTEPKVDYSSYAKYDKTMGRYRISKKYIEKEFDETVNKNPEAISRIRKLGSEISDKQREYDDLIKKRIAKVEIDDDTIQSIPKIVKQTHENFTDWDLYADAITDAVFDKVRDQLFDSKQLTSLKENIEALSKEYKQELDAVIGNLARKYKNMDLTDYKDERPNVWWDGQGYVESILASKKIDSNAFDKKYLPTQEIERGAINSWSQAHKDVWNKINSAANKEFDEENSK